MKITNKTHYDTRDLRKLFARGLKEKRASKDKVITVIYSRSGQHTGCAHLGKRVVFGTKIAETAQGDRIRVPAICTVEARTIRMHLPRDPSYVDVKKVAQVFLHEVEHTQGFEHNDMAECFNYPVLWADGLQIRVRPTPIKKPRTPSDR